jgi:hypothetical protein
MESQDEWEAVRRALQDDRLLEAIRTHVKVRRQLQVLVWFFRRSVALV